MDQKSKTNCLIIGAGGFVGKNLVEQAINNGYVAHCFLRNPDQLTIKSDDVKLIKGDVNDLEQLKAAMKGIQVIFSCFGTKNFNEGVNDRTKATENIIAAAKHCNIKRLILIGGAGILNVGQNIKLMDTENFPKFLIPVSKDHLGVFNLLQSTDLEWTFFCPPVIKDEKYSNSFNIKADFPPGGELEIAVGDLVKAMVDESFQNQFVKKRVGIMKKK